MKKIVLKTIVPLALLSNSISFSYANINNDCNMLLPNKTREVVTKNYSYREFHYRKSDNKVIENVVFRGSDFSISEFSTVTFRNVIFERTNLTKVQFHNVKFENVCFYQSNLSYSQLYDLKANYLAITHSEVTGLWLEGEFTNSAIKGNIGRLSGFSSQMLKNTVIDPYNVDDKFNLEIQKIK